MLNNNDILIRIRYILDLSDKQVGKIFQLGGCSYSAEEIRRILMKSKENSYFHEEVTDEQIEAMEENIPCSNEMLERFLNGLITHKRGKQTPRPGTQLPPEITLESPLSINNVLLKKLKIALAITGDEMLELFKSVDVEIGKSELGGLLRKEGHKHYRYCGDNYARKFLKALSQKYRPKM